MAEAGVPPQTGVGPVAEGAPGPFGPGSVSLRLYAHHELGPVGAVAELCEQGSLGLAGGFDGVMTSEHHGGFPGYLPNPLQLAGFVLAASDRGWAAACPLLLPLRSTALVAEETAWLAARYPGRVGLGVAAGALPEDFAVAGVPLQSSVPSFRAELPRLVDLLAGRASGPVAGDPALQRCADEPVRVLSAAVSAGAARRAAGAGAGLLLEGMSPAGRLSPVSATYAEAGGGGPVVLIRRAWLGTPRDELVARQRSVYGSYAAGALPPTDQTVVAERPQELAERLAETMAGAGAGALNLRVHLPGLAAEAVRSQIEAFSAEVLPPLRRLIAGPAERAR